MPEFWRQNLRIQILMVYKTCFYASQYVNPNKPPATNNLNAGTLIWIVSPLLFCLHFIFLYFLQSIIND